MKSVFLFGTAALLVAVVGCTPKLAKRDLGQRDQEWHDYLTPIYPSWKAPDALPPAVNPNSQLPPPETAPGAVTEELPPADVPPIPETTVVSESVVVGVAPDAGVAPATTTEAVTPAPAVVQEETFEEYVVQKNDSLSKIAKKFYGDGRKYYRIQKANPELQANPNRLLPGKTIRIPVTK